MRINYSDKGHGIIESIEASGVRVPFYPSIGPSFYTVEGDSRNSVELSFSDGEYRGERCGVALSVSHEVRGENLVLKLRAENKSDKDISVVLMAN